MTRLFLRCAGTCLALLLLAPDVVRAAATWRIERLATGEDGAVQRFRPGVERILAARPVPVIPMALRGMWGSLFSRRDRLRLPRRIWSRIALVIGDPIPPEQATIELLEERVKALRGDWA